MPYLKIFVHFVWSTKNRFPFLNTSDFRQSVWKHIYEYGRTKGILIDTISGYEDHCHCLILLRATQSVSKVIQLIKGESSNWINKQKVCHEKFEWQCEYFGVSVSESDLDKVRRYINNQEAHHKKRSFDEEFERLLRKYGLGK